MRCSQPGSIALIFTSQTGIPQNWRIMNKHRPPTLDRNVGGSESRLEVVNTQMMIHQFGIFLIKQNNQ